MIIQSQCEGYHKELQYTSRDREELYTLFIALSKDLNISERLK